MNELYIFSAALELKSAQARAQYLDKACGEDRETRKRIDTLLRSSENADSFLESPPADLGLPAAGHPEITEKLGTQIGPYKLLEQIGEGGMGTVYVAQQTEPLRRRVALKIIKPGMDTKQVILRFEAERQALALMDHDHIAKVYDAGATESGRPFFVMELVKGVPITEYCDQCNLSTHARLELFLAVCQALQHAHQQGIIHRDIKPTNILIAMQDGRPVPKMIDFGVAKAINQRLTEETVYTQFAQMVGTPLYMSPEQAEMSPLGVDARSDVYSLGVLLYELLTGRTPFEKDRLKEANYDELRRIIREEEPPKPSHRLSTLGESADTVAEQRRTDPRRLCKLIRGDLDWIVMKALEKDRTQRYESVSDFSDDIRSYLDNKPISAKRPSPLERMRKWSRRHKSLVRSSAVLLLAAMLSVVGILSLITSRDNRLPDGELANQDTATGFPTARAPGRYLPGIVPEPTFIPEIGRWQIITKKPRGVVKSGVWSPDEKLIALGEAGNVRIYDATNLVLLHVLVGHERHVTSVSWHPDGKRLASSSWDGTIRLWTVDGVPTHVLTGHSGEVYQVAWCPDGEQLASCDIDGTVRVWNADGTSAKVLEGHRGRVYCLDWSPDGKLLASGGGDIRPPDEKGDAGDNAIRVWDVASGTIRAKFSGQKHVVQCVDWHPDGRQLAAGDSTLFGEEKGSEVRIWNLDGSLGPVLRSDFSIIHAVAWRPDGVQLAFGGYHGGGVQLWSADQEETATDFTGNLRDTYSINWNSDGSKMLTASRESMQLWDADGNPELTLEWLPETGFTDVAWSPDGKQIASGGKLWQANGTPVEQPADEKTSDNRWIDVVDRNTDRHPTDGCRVTASSNGIRVLNAAGEIDWTYAAEGDPRPFFGAVAWSPDGNRIAAASRGEDRAVWIWDENGKLLEICKGHQADVDSIDWSPDSGWLVSGGDTTVRIWTRDGKPVRVITGHTDGVFAVAWSPDGQWIASAGYDATIRLWNPDGARHKVLRGHHGGGVCGIAWSPDSKRIVSRGWLDNTQRVWNVETAKTEWQVLMFNKEKMITLSPAGHLLHGDRDLMKRSLWYLVEKPNGAMEILTHSEFQKRYATAFSSLYVNRGITYHHTQQYEKALAAYTKAIELNPKSTRAYNYRGLTFHHMKQYEKALADYTKAIELDPKFFNAYTNRGITYRNMQQYEDALDDYSEAIKLAPKHGWAYNKRGETYRNMQQYENALADFRKAIDLDPKEPSYLGDRGSLYATLGRMDEALADYEALLKLKPNDANTFNNAAWALAMAADNVRPKFARRAVELAQRAVKLDPSNWYYWNTLGVTQYYAGDWQAAIETLNKSLELRKGEQEAVDTFFLAMAHWQLGHEDEAQTWYDRAVAWMDEKKPNDEQLIRFRKEAEKFLGIGKRKSEDRRKEKQ